MLNLSSLKVLRHLRQEPCINGPLYCANMNTFVSHMACVGKRNKIPYPGGCSPFLFVILCSPIPLTFDLGLPCFSFDWIIRQARL